MTLLKKRITLLAFLLPVAGMFLTISAIAQTLEWANRMGGFSEDAGNAIAVDDSGNVYTTGYFDGTVDFNPGSGTANLTGSLEIFVQKMDNSGN